MNRGLADRSDRNSRLGLRYLRAGSHSMERGLGGAGGSGGNSADDVMVAVTTRSARYDEDSNSNRLKPELENGFSSGYSSTDSTPTALSHDGLKSNSERHFHSSSDALATSVGARVSLSIVFELKHNIILQ